MIALYTIIFLALQIFFTFKINIGWVIFFSLLAMGFFIITRYRNLALAMVYSIFLYGGVIATFDHEKYSSQNIEFSQNIVIDKKSGKRFIFAKKDWKEYKKLLYSGKAILLCQNYKFFGKELPDSFCFLRVGDKLVKLEKQKI